MRRRVCKRMIRRDKRVETEHTLCFLTSFPSSEAIDFIPLFHLLLAPFLSLTLSAIVSCTLLLPHETHMHSHSFLCPLNHTLIVLFVFPSSLLSNHVSPLTQTAIQGSWEVPEAVGIPVVEVGRTQGSIWRPSKDERRWVACLSLRFLVKHVSSSSTVISCLFVVLLTKQEWTRKQSNTWCSSLTWQFRVTRGSNN